MADLPNRRPCINEEIGEGMIVSVSYHPQTGEPVETFLTGRGFKASDSAMANALYELGVTASKLMQKEFNDDQVA